MDNVKETELKPLQQILASVLVFTGGIYFAFKGNVLDLIGSINFKLLEELDLIGFMYANLRYLFVLTVIAALVSTVKTKNAILGWITILVLCSHVFIFGVRELFLTEAACVQYVEIKEVGPCDYAGNCKVRIENGGYMDVLKPIAGETICSREESKIQAKYSWLFVRN